MASGRRNVSSNKETRPKGSKEERKRSSRVHFPLTTPHTRGGPFFGGLRRCVRPATGKLQTIRFCALFGPWQRLGSLIARPRPSRTGRTQDKVRPTHNACSFNLDHAQH